MAFRICESRMVLSSIISCGQQADRPARLGAASTFYVRSRRRRRTGGGGEQTYRDSGPIILFITEFAIGDPRSRRAKESSTQGPKYVLLAINSTPRYQALFSFIGQFGRSLNKRRAAVLCAKYIPKAMEEKLPSGSVSTFPDQPSEISFAFQ